jgi:Tfp pilus assembly protein PilX
VPKRTFVEAQSSEGNCWRECRLLADESGVALVLALSIMMVLSLLATTILFATAANSRDAQRSNAGVSAASLAEAGVNNALAVLNANYPGTVKYPGDSTILSARTTTYASGSTTWSGSLVSVSGQSWGYEWHLSSTGTLANPTGPGTAPVSRRATATVPVILPAGVNPGSSPLNWIYGGTDVTFSQSLQVGSPVYAVRDLTLANSAKITGAAGKVGVGGNLTLTTSQNQIGLISGSDPRLTEAHVAGKCSVKGNTTLHDCGGSPTATNWDSDSVYATTTSHSLAGLLDHQPSLTCCAPISGTILPLGTAISSDMGFWYQNADLGPLRPCKTGSLPFQLDTGDNMINNSATPTTPINLTPATSSYSCSTDAGALAWDSSGKKLTLRGTIFIDGSATIDSTGYSGSPVFTYSGSGTIILSGTFAMKSTKICAVVSGSDCNWATNAWNPNSAALVIVADGDGAGGGGQGQSNTVENGYGIELVTGASFQGALIANKSIKTAQTATEQGPMVSVYNQVNAGQSGTLTFPAISFAPTAATQIANGTIPTGQPLIPRNFGG